MQRPLFFLVLLLVFGSPSLTLTNEFGFKDVVLMGWTKFWSTTCDYSNILPRSKRSVDVPKFDKTNVDELIEFLYPSADLKAADLKKQASQMKEEGRKGRFIFGSTAEEEYHTPSTLFSWIDNVKELWHTECIRQKAREDDDELKVQGPIGPNSTTERPSWDWDEKVGNYGNTTQQIEAKNKASKQVVGGGIPGVPDLLLKQKDAWFSAFGGDIEYFIPLISFGLPFDGEITFLGFHGFKGLFPYK